MRMHVNEELGRTVLPVISDQKLEPETQKSNARKIGRQRKTKEEQKMSGEHEC